MLRNVIYLLLKGKCSAVKRTQIKYAEAIGADPRRFTITTCVVICRLQITHLHMGVVILTRVYDHCPNSNSDVIDWGRSLG